jgi:ABC-type branched-subunit amino acid transport system ATPase component
VYALNGLDITIESGKITGIIGPNGSGKSTLVNVLTGLLPIDKGSMTILGEKIERIQSYQVPFLGMTRTFQDVRLFEQLSVLDNILVVLTERSVWSALFEKHTTMHIKKAHDALEKVGLLGKKDELAKNLSYGQRKLVEIARVLAMEHSGTGDIEIFLFDEPFAGLFPEMIKIVREVLLDLRNRGKAVVLIEHNMDLIRNLSDKIFVLDSGQLLGSGEPEQVLSRADVIEAYLGE